MESNGKQIIKEHQTLEDAKRASQDVALETHRIMCNVQVFKQGNRDMAAGVLPVKVLERILAYNSAQKGESADKALSANNRPIIKDHWMGFADYLVRELERGNPFIIPPFTLNSTGTMEIHTDGISQTGYAILPDEASIFITDGQHRFRGLQEALEKTKGTDHGAAFMNTGIPFMMTLESDTIQVHQDFADAGRTRSLPPSLLAVYDTRQPANAAVMKIIDRVPLLKDRVDATSNSVGKSSPFVFLVNQVRQFVKHSLTGSTTANETSFGEQAIASLTNPASMERWVRSRVAFLNVVTELVSVWKEIAQLPPPGGADASHVSQKTKEIKESEKEGVPLPLNGAFLTTLGLVSHKVLRDVTSEDIEESEMMERLRNVLKPLEGADWTRDGELWQDNIVTNGRIRTQAPAVSAASKKMLEQIGLVEETGQAQVA